MEAKELRAEQEQASSERGRRPCEDDAYTIVSRSIYGTRINVPDYMEKGGSTYRIITDHLGSVRLVVDASTGEIAQRIDYDPWGVVLHDTNPGFQPFGFAGGLYDIDTGLVRFGARDYFPECGRWSSKDRLLLWGGQSCLYVYSTNDPINLTDIYGLDWILDFANWLDSSGVSDFVTGFEDALSFGITSAARKLLGIKGGLNPCSNTYKIGSIVGQLYGLALNGAKVSVSAARFGKLPISSLFGDPRWGLEGWGIAPWVDLKYGVWGVQGSWWLGRYLGSHI
ncbi:MAG: hypothetical protein D6748_14035 [Calditrichaeota bacterium]|nr:MAG: hypothetical protein D6748_14035 [Calditrichota bacterium]